MKILTRMVSLAIVASALVFFSNCGDDDPKKTAQEVELGKLSKTWNLASASLDGNNRTVEFTNFKLIISGTFNTSTPNGPYNYRVEGKGPTPSPWDANGTWQFVNVESGSLLRNDGVPMIYAISSNGQLTISDLTCSGTTCNYSGGRTEQVNGKWTFVFN